MEPPAPLTPRPPAGYGPEVKELAFVCYVQADRNISRATRLLAEKLGEGRCPDRSVVSKWAKEDLWGLKATEAVYERFPYLNVEHAARQIDLTEQAYDTYQSIMNGDFDHLPSAIVSNKREVAKHLIDLRGLGTSGQRFGIAEPVLPALPAPAAAAADAALSPQERQRRRLDAERET